MEARVERIEHELHLPTIRLQTFFMLAVLLLAIHVLLPQVGQFQHSLKAIERADWGWADAVAAARVAPLATPVTERTAEARRDLDRGCSYFRR